ncbi:hypothetical protein N7320_21110, partial [Stutzerimonas stutzeri]
KARFEFLVSDNAVMSLLLVRYSRSFGIAIADSNPIIATVVINSISVRPRAFLMLVLYEF